MRTRRINVTISIRFVNSERNASQNQTPSGGRAGKLVLQKG